MEKLEFHGYMGLVMKNKKKEQYGTNAWSQSLILMHLEKAESVRVTHWFQLNNLKIVYPLFKTVLVDFLFFFMPQIYDPKV